MQSWERSQCFPSKSRSSTIWSAFVFHPEDGLANSYANTLSM